jgi:signal transduction histidine kinase
VAEPLENLQALLVGAPLRDEGGRVRGVLVAFSRVPGGGLPVAVERARRASGAELRLVSPSGIVFDGTPTAALPRIDANLREPVRLGARAPGFARYEGEGRSERAAAFAPVRDGWSVVIPADPTAADSTRSSVQAIALPGLAALLVVAVVVAFALDERRRRAAARSEETSRTFLAIAGHELRTPLTVVRGFAQTLSARWESMDEVARRDVVDSISRQSRSVEHVVDRLLLASQVDAGAVPTVTGPPIDVAGVIQTIVTHHSAVSPIHTFEVVVDEPGTVAVDRRLLEHILANLVENAVTFSPGGGRICISVGGRKDVRITVDDEGTGLPTDRRRLFTRFGQGEAVSTRAREDGGLGLGLFVVRSLVELAGGRVWAEDGPLGGSRFGIELPRVAAPRRPRRSRQRATATPTG